MGRGGLKAYAERFTVRALSARIEQGGQALAREPSLPETQRALGDRFSLGSSLGEGGAVAMAAHARRLHLNEPAASFGPGTVGAGPGLAQGQGIGADADRLQADVGVRNWEARRPRGWGHDLAGSQIAKVAGV